MLPKIDKRRQGMQQRTKTITDAAKSLIEERGGTEFTVSELAEKSGVSIQTIYNLCGSKSAVLYILLIEIVDAVDAKIFEHRGNDPIDWFLNSVDSVSSIYLSHPVLYGSLLRHLFGVKDAINRPRFIKKGQAFWQHALEPIFKSNPESPIDQAHLADDMLYLTTGVLETWIQGDISDAQFRNTLRRGAVLNLLALDIPGTRDRLLAEIAAARA